MFMTFHNMLSMHHHLSLIVQPVSRPLSLSLFVIHFVVSTLCYLNWVNSTGKGEQIKLCQKSPAVFVFIFILCALSARVHLHCDNPLSHSIILINVKCCFQCPSPHCWELHTNVKMYRSVFFSAVCSAFIDFSFSQAFKSLFSYHIKTTCFYRCASCYATFKYILELFIISTTLEEVIFCICVRLLLSNVNVET